MCVVADTDNKLGRTQIDPRGKISLFVGYSTQHAGDVYRLLNPKTSRVIHSRDVKWIGKMWAEFYKIKIIDRASGYVDPDEDFQLEEDVEKPLFSIGLISSCADQFSSLCSPMQRLLPYMYLSQLMSTFTNYLKVHRSLDGYFIQ